MGIKINSRGLFSFQKKVDSSDVNGLADVVADKIAARGEEIAKEKYAGAIDVVVSRTKAVNGECQVTAEGDKIAYMEFGTGLVGKGTYEGKLPTQTLTFVSPKNSGAKQTTNGWEYNYPNPRTKRDGQGWYYDGKYTQGEVAQAQMFKTAQELRQEIVKTGVEAIKGDK